MAPHELQAIEKTMPSEVEQMDEIQSQVTAPHRMNDIGPLLHFSRTPINANDNGAGTLPYLPPCV